jgi:hypothetical protein
LWRVIIRRPAGEPRYYIIPGGSNALYNADAVQRGKPAVLVEAALDALAIQQEAGDLVAAVATGTTGARGIHWIGKLAGCNPILLSYDNDQGGNQPTTYWRDVFRERAHIWRPYPDDPAAMLEHGFDVRGWVAAGLRHAGYMLSERAKADELNAGTDTPAAPASPEPAPASTPPAQPAPRARSRVARNVTTEPLRLHRPDTHADAATVVAHLDCSGTPTGWHWDESRPYTLVNDASGQRTSMDVNKQRVIIEALSLALDWPIQRAHAAYTAHVAAEVSEQEDI